MRKMSAIAGALLAAAASPALAQQSKDPTWSVEASYGRLSIADTFDFNIVQLRLGRQFSEHFSIEAEAGTGVGDDTARVGPFQVQGQINWTAGIYAVGRLPFSAKDSVHVRAGYRAAELEVDAGLGSSTGEAQGAAVGLGYQHTFGDGAGAVRFDFTHADLDGETSQEWSVSLSRRF